MRVALESLGLTISRFSDRNSRPEEPGSVLSFSEVVVDEVYGVSVSSSSVVLCTASSEYAHAYCVPVAQSSA